MSLKDVAQAIREALGAKDELFKKLDDIHNVLVRIHNQHSHIQIVPLADSHSPKETTK